MSSFHARLRVATDFETEVLNRFNDSGWEAFKFGQSQLPAECRKLLIKFEDGSRRPSLIRWMPDIIAFRELKRGVWFALIDAKACGDRPNYALEMSAVETAEAFTDSLYTPTFFVFDDWKVLTPREARQRGIQGKVSSNGSGTPYIVVPKQFGRPFDSIFPPVRRV